MSDEAKGSQLERLLTVREAAERMGLSREAIRYAARNGDLIATRFGEKGWYHIAESELAAWVARHRHQPPPKVVVPPLVPPPNRAVRPRKNQGDRVSVDDLLPKRYRGLSLRDLAKKVDTETERRRRR